jgi:hypothetical protein
VPAVAAVGAAIAFRVVFPAAPDINPATERKALPVVQRHIVVPDPTRAGARGVHRLGGLATVTQFISESHPFSSTILIS